MMHGFLDDVVPLDQSRMMATAPTAAGKKVELRDIPKEGHSPSTRRRDRERLERVITS